MITVIQKYPPVTCPWAQKLAIWANHRPLGSMSSFTVHNVIFWTLAISNSGRKTNVGAINAIKILKKKIPKFSRQKWVVGLGWIQKDAV
jgi:hypothetical protein